METFTLTENVASLRFVEVNGRQFAVAPITILRSRVLPGSRGALFYPADENKRVEEQWNGKPLVSTTHPRSNGQNISANTPEIFQNQEIGRFYKSKVDQQGTNTGEGWFDVELTKKHDSRIYNALLNKQKIEVSTGLYTDNEEAPQNSSFDGTSYTHIARNYRPDHIAILVDEKGACSIKDGCGVYNSNSSSGNDDPTTNPAWVKDHSKWEKAKEQASKEGKGTDYAYITGIYKQMGGEISNNSIEESMNDWLVYNAGWTQEQRDALPSEDFAGPNQSFPIKSQQDVYDAARLIGHADNPEAVKHKIIAIAKRKGFKIPDAWMPSTNNASGGNCGDGAGGFQPGNTCAGGSGESDKLESDIHKHLSESGKTSLSEIRKKFGGKHKFDSHNPLAHPVHKALKSLRDKGKVKAHESQFGEPYFTANSENSMNEKSNIITWLTTNCSCMKDKKQHLEGLTDNALKEVILENAEKAVENDADQMFLNWISNADKDIRNAISTYVKGRIGNAFGKGNQPNKNPQQQDTTGSDTDTSAAMDAEMKKKQMMMQQTANNNQVQNNEPTTIDEFVKRYPFLSGLVANHNANENAEKQQLIGRITAPITDNTAKQQAVTTLNAKSVDELRTIAMFVPQPQQQQTQSQTIPFAQPVVNFFGATGGNPQITDNSYLQKEVLTTNSPDWKEWAKNTSIYDNQKG